MPQSRNEQLLENWRDGEAPTIEPQSRVEAWLAKIAGADVGTEPPQSRVEELLEEIEQGLTPPPSGTIEIDENGTYDVGAYATAEVDVPNPSTGTLSITQNNDYDVTAYATASVNVPNPSTGTLSITENGDYDVSQYAAASVDVAGSGGLDIADVVEGKITAVGTAQSPVQVTKIGQYALAYNTDLQSAYIENVGAATGNVSSVFANCSALQAVGYSGFKQVGMYFFHNCSSLTSVHAPDVETVNGNAFNGCSGLASLELPACKLISSSYVFKGCTNLQSVSLPSCTNIGGFAFQNCSKLTVFDLSGQTSQVVALGGNAFQGTPFAGSGTPQGTPQIKVPQALLASYQADSAWSAYSAYLVGV